MKEYFDWIFAFKCFNYNKMPQNFLIFFVTPRKITKA